MIEFFHVVAINSRPTRDIPKICQIVEVFKDKIKYEKSQTLKLNALARTRLQTKILRDKKISKGTKYQLTKKQPKFSETKFILFFVKKSSWLLVKVSLACAVSNALPSKNIKLWGKPTKDK